MATKWAVLKAKARLQRGWVPWVTTRGLRWARRRDDRIEQEPIPADEEAALDQALQEEKDAAEADSAEDPGPQDASSWPYPFRSQGPDS